MSALLSSTDDNNDDTKTYHFKQSTTIPSYLIAIAAGNLAGREIGPRSTVWCEPEVVEQAAWEFDVSFSLVGNKEHCIYICLLGHFFFVFLQDTERFIATGESLLTPYEWGRYDLLVLPPSFPYGGMEVRCVSSGPVRFDF